MPTYIPRVKTCSICGTSPIHNQLAACIEFKGPDIDLRPAEPRRSTMAACVQQCPQCGLCAVDLDEPPPRGAASSTELEHQDDGKPRGAASSNTMTFSGTDEAQASSTPLVHQVAGENRRRARESLADQGDAGDIAAAIAELGGWDPSRSLSEASPCGGHWMTPVTSSIPWLRSHTPTEASVGSEISILTW